MSQSQPLICFGARKHISGPADSQLRVAHHDETTSPGFDIGAGKNRTEFLHDRWQVRPFETNENEAGVSARSEHACVAEADVLRNQQSSLRLGGNPNIAVNAAGEAFGVNVFYVVAESPKGCDEIRRQILVEFDAHSDRGNAGDREVFFRGSGCEGDHSLDVPAGKRREIAKKIFLAATDGEAGQKRAQRNAGTSDDRFTPADLRVLADVIVVVHGCKNIMITLRYFLERSIRIPLPCRPLPP